MSQGKNPVDCWVKRHKKGIKVHVEVWPEVEEFFKHHGGGIVQPPQFGRNWKPFDEAAKRIDIWSFQQHLNPSGQYDVLSTGTPLVNDGGVVNISFLRLVGASEPGGKDLIIEQVISNPEIRQLGARITKAAEQFYMDYIQPINLRLYVGVLDMTRVPNPPATPPGDTRQS